MPNSAPSAFDQNIQVLKNKSMTLYVKANDADGDELNYKINPAEHGTIVRMPVPSTIIYVPDRNYVGPDVFTVTVDDGHGGVLVQTITLNIRDYVGSSDSLYPAIIPPKGSSNPSTVTPTAPAPLTFEQTIARLREIFAQK